MENTVVDFFQISENSEMTVGTINNKASFMSFIKINGKPILPPLINEEKKREMQMYKQKALEKEVQLAKQKKNSFKASEIFSFPDTLPNYQSTPTRPATLNLCDKNMGKTFVLSESNTDESLSNHFKGILSDCEVVSNQNNFKSINKSITSTLEQRLASEDSTILVRNKINKFKQSPIIEEQISGKVFDSDDSNTDSRWSPLKTDTIHSLKIELPTKGKSKSVQNLEIFLDETQNIPETVTDSSNLTRQNSYTILNPSPALINYMETQKETENSQRSQSGRKTWDLTKAKKNWDPSGGKLGRSSDEGDESEIYLSNNKCSSSLDSFSAFHNNIDQNECSTQNSFAFDTESSPDSYNSKKTPKFTKVKCKLKGKKAKSFKNVPSSKPVDKTPVKNQFEFTQDSPNSTITSDIKNDLTNLSDLLLKMKVDHERQKRELEEKQQSEMKKLETIFHQKEAELLSKVNELPKKYSKCIYSQTAGKSLLFESDNRMMGDGSHQQLQREKFITAGVHSFSKRPHSAKDFHPQFYLSENECNRRTRSMDFNQDTDLDISFQEELASKDALFNNDYAIESDSASNFSSRSSTISSENKKDSLVCKFPKFQGVSSEENLKFIQASAKITAAARGFLTRRLLRTAHVQGLITTLRDAITCATQLHNASDIADSDIDLMRRLGRQIEAAWDAVYSVFFGTDKTTQLQLIAADRERLKATIAKTQSSSVKKKRISSATKKSLDRKKGGSFMSKSQTSANGFSRMRTCTKMAASYPSPQFPQRLNS